MKFLKPVPAHYKVADKNCDCRELFRSSFCGAYPPHPPTLFFLAVLLSTISNFHFFQPCFYVIGEIVQFVMQARNYVSHFIQQHSCQVNFSTRHLWADSIDNVATEDTPLMKYYTKHLVKEIELIEGAKLTTEQGHMAEFRFQLIPADMK